MGAILPLKSGLRRLVVVALAIALELTLPTGTITNAALLAETPAPANSKPAKPIFLTDPEQDPKQDGVLWFPTTGHTLRGSFLTYWLQNGGLAQFGYPLTEEFFEPVGTNNKSVQVQYFERNRFEHHPENQPPCDVLLGTLGRDFHSQDAPAQRQSSPALYFAETGHNLSGAFQQYWQTHGGLAVQGYPITEAFQDKNPVDGKQYTMQYFQRSRFELHPENAGSPYEVLLGLLGRQLSEKKGYPFGLFPPYGHSVNNSWITGRYLPSRLCFFAECECPIVTYDTEGGKSLVPWGQGWTSANDSKQVRPGTFIVLFGSYRPGDDVDPICKPNFLVDSAQSNGT